MKQILDEGMFSHDKDKVWVFQNYFSDVNLRLHKKMNRINGKQECRANIGGLNTYVYEPREYYVDLEEKRELNAICSPKATAEFINRGFNS